jgi:oxepin-CoA hydrolase/3-oxo-5,6-dehydrosuberyl-CoA semialdehyde dehydrogenase
MLTLTSYVQDQWRAGLGAPARLDNPTSEEPLAECSSDGLDWRGLLDHARTVGGPALRRRTFAERGEMLKALSAALHAAREELIEVSIQNAGTTRSDAKFDVDGAIGTLAAYAQYGAELGGKQLLSDGEGLQLGRSPRFFGQHVLVPRLGAALHVNAFNFPAWNMMEKAACALLAGCPVIEKPGTPTALVAWRVAKIAVECGALPRGAFQFVAGSIGKLFDHLGPQDGVAFTGSSATAALLKAHPAVVRHNVRLNIEADSLNAAVLGPDVEPGSETYNLFLSNVVLDMTQKTGQKCTAVRRVLVSAERLAGVRDDLVSELGRIKVGDPSDNATRMGPLASRSQLEDVRAGIARLTAVGRAVCGGAGALRERGYFVAPTLIEAREAGAAPIHADEVFGPVATLVPYSGRAEEAAELVARGQGALVGSVYSNDASFVRAAVTALAPWHGRLWLGSDKMAEQSLPPGMVLPGLVHGGPGRAGGGEELGALRGLGFYLQRTALQGFKGVLADLVG